MLIALAAVVLSWFCASADGAAPDDPGQARLRQQLQQARKAGNHVASARLYEELLRQAPDDSSLVLGLTRALEALEAYPRIVALLQPWVSAHPEDREAGVRLGRAYERLGDRERAFEAWRGALTHAPPRPQLYLDISDHCRAAGLYQEAVQVLLEGRQDLGQEGLFAWELAGLYLQLEDYSGAVTAYRATLDEQPQRRGAIEYRLRPVARDPARAPQLVQALGEAVRTAEDPLQISLLLSSCALEAGDPLAGFQVLAGISDTPEAAAALFQYATRCRERGHDEVALLAYDLLAEHGQGTPYYYRAVLRQAEIEVRRRDHGRAVEIYARLAQRFPRRAEAREALVRLGRLQLEVMGDVEGARTSLTRAIEASRSGPWASRALALLAECALRQDDLEEARGHYRKLERRDPDAAQGVSFSLAEIAFFQGDFEEAAALLQAVLDGDPAHPAANDALVLLTLMEDPQSQPEALAAFATAELRERQRRPGDAASHWQWLAAHGSPPLRQLGLLSRARQREQSDRPAAALALYEELVEQFPDGRHALDGHMGRARLYEARGEAGLALRTYETALLDVPEDVRAAEIRLHIQRLRRVTSEEARLSPPGDEQTGPDEEKQR